jgi:ABC-type hemin transport system ATPase subunit
VPEEQVAAAVEAALELVNMQEFMHRATHTLSGGQRQRVAIAGVCEAQGWGWHRGEGLGCDWQAQSLGLEFLALRILC